jgi:virginiamycin B lyase
MLKPRLHRGRAAVTAVVVVVSAAIGLPLSAAAGASAEEASVALPSSAFAEFPIVGESSNATGLTVDSEGNLWFTETAPGRIDRIAPSGTVTGEFAVTFGIGVASWPEAYSEPTSIAAAPNGYVWFTDMGTNKEGRNLIGNVTRTGSILEFPIPAVGSRPAGIALGAEGDMWFTEEGVGSIGRITEDGSITEFTIPEVLEPRPRAITLGADGNMWFTDLGLSEDEQNLIGRITPEGVIKEFALPPPFTSPDALTLGSDGSIWFTESPDAIGRITPDGIITEFTVPSVSGSQNGIALGPDGNIWFTENDNALGRITPAGVVTSFTGLATSTKPPQALIQGPGASLWYTDGDRIGRLNTPIAPANEAVPTLSGQTVEDQSLSVSQGAWFHAPAAFGYQWQICDESGAGCADIAGQNEASHALTASDVGHTLRAVVTASNLGGVATAVSNASAVVQAAPRTPQQALLQSLPPGAAPAVEPLPVVASAMTWNFGWARRYTLVSSLVVRDIPAGGSVEVSCRGGNCPFARWRSNTVAKGSACKHRCKAKGPALAHGEIDLAALFAGRHLQVGARVVVTVAKQDWISKSFVFTIRADKPPRVQIACLGSGPSNPTGSC